MEGQPVGMVPLWKTVVVLQKTTDKINCFLIMIVLVRK